VIPRSAADMLEEALREPGPVVVDAIVDRFEPRMPPKVAVKQAAKTAEALAKGTPQPNEDRSEGCLGYSSRSDLICKLRGGGDPKRSFGSV
jgi:hypothetical protein